MHVSGNFILSFRRSENSAKVITGCKDNLVMFVFSSKLLKTILNRLSETKTGKHAADLIEGDTDQLKNIKKPAKINLHRLDR